MDKHWPTFLEWEKKACLAQEPTLRPRQLVNQSVQAWGRIEDKIAWVRSLRSMKKARDAIRRHHATVTRQRRALLRTVNDESLTVSDLIQAYQSFEGTLRSLLQQHNDSHRALVAFLRQQEAPAVDGGPASHQATDRSLSHTKSLLHNNRQEITELRREICSRRHDMVLLDSQVNGIQSDDENLASMVDDTSDAPAAQQNAGMVQYLEDQPRLQPQPKPQDKDRAGNRSSKSAQGGAPEVLGRHQRPQDTTIVGAASDGRRSSSDARKRKGEHGERRDERPASKTSRKGTSNRHPVESDPEATLMSMSDTLSSPRQGKSGYRPHQANRLFAPHLQPVTFEQHRISASANQGADRSQVPMVSQPDPKAILPDDATLLDAPTWRGFEASPTGAEASLPDYNSEHIVVPEIDTDAIKAARANSSKGLFVTPLERQNPRYSELSREKRLQFDSKLILANSALRDYYCQAETQVEEEKIITGVQLRDILYILVERNGTDHDWANEKDIRQYYHLVVPQFSKPMDLRSAAEKLGFGSPEGYPNHWNFLDTVGVGGYGHAGLWVQYDSNNRIVNAQRTVVKETWFEDPADWDRKQMWHSTNPRVPRETHIHGLLFKLPDSQSIVKLHAWTVDEERGMYPLYMPHCVHGSLHNAFIRHRQLGKAVDTEGKPLDPLIPVPALWSLFETLSHACSVMHHGALPDHDPPPRPFWPAHPIIHRDLKPANIFLSSPSPIGSWPNRPTAYLGDFGLAIQITPRTDPIKVVGYGTPGYIPPEQAQYIPHMHLGAAANVWAVGKVMVVCMGGGIDAREVEESVRESFPADLVGLVERCLVPEAGGRIGAQELVREIHAIVTRVGGWEDVPMKWRRGEVGLRVGDDVYAGFAK